jgi:hypothetical protein
MKTIQRKPAVVWRGGRAHIQNVYTCQHNNQQWIYVLRKQHPVIPHPNGRGYIVVEVK